MQAGGVIDSDQHLIETSGLWLDYCDPAARPDALRIERGRLGYPWLVWRDEVIGVADLDHPGDVDSIGRLRERIRRGLGPDSALDLALLPPAFTDPASRVQHLDRMGVDETFVLPHFGLFWERALHRSLPALTANMGAWNRWCATVVHDGGGRLHPVAHLTLRDEPWLLRQLAMLSDSGVRLAMIAPSLVDGRPLSHPDHDRLWAAFVERGITPVFHTADQPPPFGEGWYTDRPGDVDPVLQMVFLWTAAALACSDLILNGVLERHPDLRIGCLESSAMWVPMHLRLLDAGYRMAWRLNGRPVTDLADDPSEYFLRQVRVAAFAYERPLAIARQSGPIFMACSDYPHSVGTTSIADAYDVADPDMTNVAATGILYDNAAFLLRQ